MKSESSSTQGPLIFICNTIFKKLRLKNYQYEEEESRETVE